MSKKWDKKIFVFVIMCIWADVYRYLYLLCIKVCIMGTYLSIGRYWEKKIWMDSYIG